MGGTLFLGLMTSIFQAPVSTENSPVKNNFKNTILQNKEALQFKKLEAPTTVFSIPRHIAQIWPQEMP